MRRASNEPRGIALRAFDAFEGVSSSRLLDRLIRSRLWIGLLAFALIGIVAMQLLVLEMNTGIGRKLARVAQLQLANAQLGIEDSGASGEARIDPLAAASGMTFAPSGSVHFVAASTADVARAASVLASPAKAPVSSTPEPSSSASASSTESGEASSSSATSSGQAAETTGSEAGSSTASTGTESSPGQSTAAATESSPPVTGTTASSATSPETSSASQAAPPAGAAGGVQAGVGE